MTPANHKLQVWVGNTKPVLLRFFADDERTVPYSFVGVDVYFTCFSRKNRLLVKTNVDSTLDIQNGNEVAFEISTEESRMLSRYPNVTYEVELRESNTEKTWLEGAIVFSGGANLDA